MKNRIKNTALILCLMLISFNSFAYTFPVFGTVTDSNGVPVPQQIIDLTLEDAGAFYTYTATTDMAGFYTVTFDIVSDSALINIQTYSVECNQFYFETVFASPNTHAQVDFQFCAGNPVTCDLYFYYMSHIPDPLIVEFYPMINFSDLTNTTYYWDFGDGTSSTEMSPVHEYSAIGEYPVTLTATNDICGTMTASDIVFIMNDSINNPDCFADFFFMFDSINSYTMNFIDLSYSSSEIVSWTWDFGDNTTSTEQNPAHTYNADGEYFVVLTIESADGCASTIEIPIWIGEYVWYPEECQALFFPEYGNNDFLTVAFMDLSWSGNDTGINAWQWTFGDGTGSSEQNPTHTYASEGEYLVTLTIYSDGCTSTFEEFVFIGDWGYNGDCQTLFFPEFDSTQTAVQFFDMSMPVPEMWLWDFGDGTTSIEQNPYHVFPGVGVYTVMLETQSNLCASAFAMEIEIFEHTDNGKNVTYSGTILNAYAYHSNMVNIEDNKQKENIFTIYPNPVNDVLNINFGEKTDAEIEIITITGKVVKKTESNNDLCLINTSNLPEGVYFVRVNTNGNLYIHKFVK